MAASTVERNFYAENLPGNKYLSKTFQSSVLHTPSNTSRRTISTENYLRQIAKDFHQPPTPWGRKNSYGGRSFIHLKGTPTGHDMVIVAKGSQHYGSGVSATPRGVTVQQAYSITPLMKSNLRSNDELTPSPVKVNMQEHQVDKPFPAGHPCQSHISETEMFPSTSIPANDVYIDHEQQNTSDQDYIHPADSPAAAPEQSVFSKTHGSPYRHEEISIPLDSRRKPMTWPQGPTFYQVPRSFQGDQNKYYPTPRTQLNSNGIQYRHPASKTTLSALNDANKSLWKSTYQNDFIKVQQQSRHLQQNKECSKESEIITRLINENSKPKPQNIEENLKNNKVRFNDATIKIENNMEQPKYIFSRPKYNGPRPFTSITSKEPIKPILTQRSQTSAPQKNISNEKLTRYSPIELEKTGLHRQFATDHPSTKEVPDLRNFRDNKNLPMQKRHFIPEANTMSYTFQ